MEMHLRIDILKDYDFDTDEYLVLETQREANCFLNPEELAELSGVSVEKSRSAARKIAEIMMLSRLH